MINLTQFNAVESFLKEAVEEGVFPGCNFGIITPDEKKFCSVGYRQTALTHWIQSTIWLPVRRSSLQRAVF